MRPIDRTSPLPLWAQVLDDLRARLEAGEFTGEFPTDLVLTSEYGVSRHTAREAVRRLQAEGVVSRERGRGTFVTTPVIEQPTGAIYSLFRSIEASGIEQRSQVLSSSVVTDSAVADRLGLDEGAELVRIERLRFADNSVLAHDTSWLPIALGAPLLDADFSHTALYDELTVHTGVRPSAGTEWIATELPSDAERTLLGIGPRQPVFRIHRLATADGAPVEWRETVLRGDRYTFVAQWSPSGSYETVLRSNDALV